MAGVKRILVLVLSLLFGLGLGAFLHSGLMFGFADLEVTWSAGSMLTLAHVTTLLVPLLLGALLASRLPRERLRSLAGPMTPLRWSLALALGPAVCQLVKSATGISQELLPTVSLLAGVLAAAILLRLLPRSPIRAGALQAAGGLATLGVLVALLSGLSAVSPAHDAVGELPPAPDGAPDIVLVSVDTLRADALDAPELELPALEFLAANGMRRPAALAPSPYTLPSHVSMLSGVSPLEHGCYSNFHLIPQGVDMVAEQLRRRGYHTRAVVSNAVLDRHCGVSQGFELYDDSRVLMSRVLLRTRNEMLRVTWMRWMPARRSVMERFLSHGYVGTAEVTTSRALDNLRELGRQERPFFFFLHYMEPHLPYTPDPSVRGSISGSPVPPFRFGQQPGSHPEMSAIAEALAAGEPQARSALDYYHKVYLEELLYLDRQLQPVLDQLRASGRPTVLLFTGDHGEHFGEYGLVAHGNSLHWPLLEVPWILWKSDGLPAGLQVPERPRLEDARRILFECAGLAPEGGAWPERWEHEVAHWQTPPEISLANGREKLIARYERRADGSIDFDEIRYFDLSADPREESNLADARPDQVRALLKAAIRYLEQAAAGEVQEIGDLQRAQLMALGYADS